MMTLSRSILLAASARSPQHQHLMTQLPFLIKGDAWPGIGAFMLHLHPSLSLSAPSPSRAPEKNAFAFNLNTTESMHFDILYRQSIPCFHGQECIFHAGKSKSTQNRLGAMQQTSIVNQQGSNVCLLWFKITRDNYLVVPCLMVWLSTEGKP